MRKPATPKDNEFIEDGKIVTFQPKTKALKEYKKDLNQRVLKCISLMKRFIFLEDIM
jgi:hypothetical protein